MYVLEKSELVIKCDAMMIERLGADRVINSDHATMMEAILTRDQRTTVHRVLDRSSESTTVPLLFMTTSEKSSSTSCRRSRNETKAVRDSMLNLQVPNTRTDKNDVKIYSKVPSCDPCLVSRSSCERRIRSSRKTISVCTWLSKFLIIIFIPLHWFPQIKNELVYIINLRLI